MLSQDSEVACEEDDFQKKKATVTHPAIRIDAQEHVLGVDHVPMCGLFGLQRDTLAINR